jgi:Zn-dependent protease
MAGRGCSAVVRDRDGGALQERGFGSHPLVRLLNTTWPLFRAFRVEVRAGFTIAIWPVFFFIGFVRWMPAVEALAWSVAWTVALFTTTWIHEMGHIAMGRRRGIESRQITLRGLGGLAHLDAPASTPGDEIRISLAGPATHLAWMAVLFPATALLRPAHGHDLWFLMLDAFAWMQIMFLVFNLLPVYPLDGGRVLRGLLSFRRDSSRASFIVGTVGLAGNGLFVVYGFLAACGGPDLLGSGPYGFLLAWIGIEGFQACRRLRLEAKFGGAYAPADPFERLLLASRAAGREGERRERRERERERSRREERRRLEEEVDGLLDRANLAGGVDRLSRGDRRALERATRKLAPHGHADR